MTKKKFLIILVIAITVCAVLSIIVGVQTYQHVVLFENPENVVSWLSLLLPGLLSFMSYKKIKEVFDATLGLVVAATFMAISSAFIIALPRYNQVAASVIEALNCGLLLFVIGIICIFKILREYFDNYNDLE